MESDQNPQGETNVAQGSRFENLRKVTPLSKYLAMALFIILPFLGGYIGYTYAPEKMVEVERVVEVGATQKNLIEVKNTDVKYEKPRYGSFVNIDPSLYTIPKNLVPEEGVVEVPLDTLEPKSARKLNDNLVILTISDNQDRSFPYATVIYDITEDKVVRQIKYPWAFVDEWNGLKVRVSVEQNRDDTSKIMIYDYVNNREEILYEEKDPDVQLLDVCEVGCKGLLYITSDGKVIFGRHQRIERTTGTKLIEVVVIPIPDEYLIGYQKQYSTGMFQP